MRKQRDFFKRYHINKYQRDRYKNPYFQRKRKRNQPWLKRIVFSFVIFAIIFFAYLFSAPRFSITNIEVTGTEFVSSNDIVQTVKEALEKSRFLIFPGTNSFLLKEERLQEALNERFIFDSLDIKVKGNTIYLTIKERVSSLIWKTGEKSYFVDINGTVIRELSESDLETNIASLPVFYDKSNTDISVGQNILNTNIIQGAFDFLRLLEQGGVKVDLINVETPQSEWLSARTGEGYEIYFDPIEKQETQANNLFVIIRESIGDTSGITYIDLRFGDHVYYK